MLKSKYIGLLFLVLAILMACQYPSPVTLSGDMPQKKRDSVNYLMERHYTLNSNFEVTSDSLMLQQLPLVDVLPVFKGERLVVAEFMIQAADSVDSVWVKVARDQETMGWIHEKELLEKVVPVDSVSQFIHFFSNSHTIAFFVILGFFGIWYIHRAIRRQKLQLIWLNDIDSVFPTVLSWLVATAATLYASIQHFVPGTWEQFYYNPSLNPFSLPFILSLFMFNIWGIILVGLATLDDLFHQTHIEAACFYLLGLMSCCIFLYLFFTFTTYYYLLIRLCFCFVLPLCILAAAIPYWTLRIYTDDVSLIEYAIPSLWVMLTTNIPCTAAFIYQFSVSGTGNTRTALTIVACTSIVYVAYTALLVYGLHADVALCWTADHVYYGCTLTASYLYMRYGNWRARKI